MTRAVLVLSLIAACSDSGISIEVQRGETDADRVELYVVDDHCVVDGTEDQACPRLKTPSAPAYLDGEIYVRRHAAPFTAEVGADGVAYFRITPGDKHTFVPLVVAVGFRGTTQVGAVLLGTGFETAGPERRIVTLDKLIATEVDGGISSDGLRAEVWYQDEGERGGCLAFESWTNGARDFRKFIVPADDLDCDDWIAPEECDEIYPDRPPSTTTLFPYGCAVEQSDGVSAHRCLLGNRDCVDGEGQAACLPNKSAGSWCVSSGVCEQCADATNDTCTFGALEHPTPGITHVRCEVPSVLEVNTTQVCNQQLAATLDAMGLFDGMTVECSDIDIAKVTSTGFGTWARQAPGVTLGPVGATCSLEVSFFGALAGTPTHLLSQHVMRVKLRSGVSLILPVEVALVRPSETCKTAVASCQLVRAAGGQDPSLASCATAP